MSVAYQQSNRKGVQWWPPKRYVHVIIPGTCQRDLIFKKIFADVIELPSWRWDHPGLFRWDLSLMTSVVMREHGVGGCTEDKAVWTQRRRRGWCRQELAWFPSSQAPNIHMLRFPCLSSNLSLSLEFSKIAFLFLLDLKKLSSFPPSVSLKHYLLCIFIL